MPRGERRFVCFSSANIIYGKSHWLPLDRDATPQAVGPRVFDGFRHRNLYFLKEHCAKIFFQHCEVDVDEDFFSVIAHSSLSSEDLMKNAPIHSRRMLYDWLRIGHSPSKFAG